MKHAIVAIILGICAGMVFGQGAEKFTIAGGGGAKNGSTYSAMLGDLSAVCSTEDMSILEVESSGSVQSKDMLLGNQVKAALIQSDVLLAAKLENPSSVAPFKTLFTLHPEEVHLIARADTKKEGGVTIMGKNIGGDNVVFNTPDDLKGRPVGAVGGSVVSAQIINSFLHLNWQVTPYKSTAELLKALQTHAVDSIVIVAGAPSTAVAKLDANFKLLPIRSNSELAAVYSPTKVQYSGMNGGRAVDTISELAIVVTRTFRSPEMLANLARLRACFYENLPKIQDKDGTHAKWQDVKADERGKWEWYDLPKAAAAAAPAVPTMAPVVQPAAPAKRK